jgi:glycosyltransferase involved in cell wall biosynthesis
MITERSILHVSTWDSGGGAANATRQLLQAQIDSGMNSKMFVGFKNTKDENILAQNFIFKTFSRILPLYSQRKSLPLTSIFKRDFNDFIFSSNPKKSVFDNRQSKIFNQFDLIHLHWISSGFISNRLLNSLIKPIIWTLCDMWPITGGCHYSGICNGFKNECGRCPIIKSKKFKDISYKNLLIRKNAIESKKLFIVGKSKWMSDQASKSMIFRNARIETIGNIVNTRIFSPKINQNLIKSARKKIGVGGVNYLNLSRKNSIDLDMLFKELHKNNFDIVLFGVDSNSKHLTSYMRDCINRNILKVIEENRNPEVLNKIYHEFDVYIHTAKFENLSNQILEILSSGIPVIAFDVGGNPDLVINDWNGFLLKSPDLGNIIQILKELSNPLTYYRFSQNARSHIMNNYSTDIIMNKYLHLYNEILKK